MADAPRRTNAEILQDTKDTEARIAKDVLGATLKRLRIENKELRAKLSRTSVERSLSSADEKTRTDTLDLSELRAVNDALRAAVHRDATPGPDSPTDSNESPTTPKPHI
jgi:hypothetical protein